MPTVWITGSGGLIGQALVQSAARRASHWKVVGKSRDQLNLTDPSAMSKAFQAQPPDAIIHCAALTRTPVCQAEPAQARRINVDATATLAELAADIPFLFFSTDLVFDGRTGPYDESSAVNPLNVYAETKAEAERIVLRNPRHSVIRTSLNGGKSPTGDRGFNEEMRRAWRQGKVLSLFTDEYRCPIAAVETAETVWALLLAQRPGLYHVAGSERLSRWRMGELLASRCPELKPRFVASSLREYQGPPRSPDIHLRCDKIQAALPIRLPGLSEWLQANPDAFF